MKIFMALLTKNQQEIREETIKALEKTFRGKRTKLSSSFERE